VAKANVLNWVDNVIIKSNPSIANIVFELEIHELSKFNLEAQESKWKTKIKFFLYPTTYSPISYEKIMKF